MKIIIEVLLGIWQLPTVIVGGILIAFIRIFDKNSDFEDYKDVWVVLKTSWPIGVSFGPIIIVYNRASSNTMRHEYGHSIQSKILGPLYLLIVGIPSFVGNILTRMLILRPENYYKRFPENWADKIAGVVRK